MYATKKCLLKGALVVSFVVAGSVSANASQIDQLVGEIVKDVTLVREGRVLQVLSVL